MNGMIKTLISVAIIVSFPCTLFAELLSDEDTLVFNQGIEFSAYSSIYNLDWGNNSECEGPIDFFYVNAGNCCLAIGCNCGFRMGSSEVLYRSKKPFSSFDFTNEIVLNEDDFIQASSGTWGACDNFNSLFEPSDMGTPDYSDYEPYFLLLKSLKREYVLLRIKYIPLPKEGGDPTMYAGGDRIQIRWWLQTDGSLDFKDLKDMGAVMPPFHPDRGRQHVNPGERTYSLKGERFAAADRINGLVILQEPAGRISKSLMRMRTDK